MKEEIRKIFIQETSSDLALIHEELVKNAKDLFSGDTMEKVFRTMHTITGAAPMVGFDHLREVAIPVEKAYKELKDGQDHMPLELVEKTTDVIKLLQNALLNSEVHMTSTSEEKALIEYFKDIC